MEMRNCPTCHQLKLLIDYYEEHYQCKLCDNYVTRAYANTFGGFLNQLFRTAKKNAIKRVSKGRQSAGKFEITVDDIHKLWKKQNGLCYYSKIPMVTQTCSNWQASLERLDNNNGYVIDNIVLCCLEFNHKTKWSQEKINYLFSPHPSNLDGIDFNLYFVYPKNRQYYVKIMVDDKECYECHYCHQIKERKDFSKLLGHGCKSCYSRRKKDKYTNPRVHMQNLLANAKHSTKNREKKSTTKARDNSFDIDFDFLVDLFKKQGGRCAYSGIPLTFGSYFDHWWVCSLERKDPLKGYTRDNVCLIAIEFNTGVFTSRSKKDVVPGSGGWNSHKFEYFRELYMRNNVNLQTEIITNREDLSVPERKKFKIILKSKTHF